MSRLYNEIISSKINDLCDKKYIDKTKIDEAESSVLVQYMYKVMQQSLKKRYLEISLKLFMKRVVKYE